MDASFAWVLNLDADVELGSGSRYAPTKSVRAAMAPMIARVSPLLVGPNDVLVDEESAPGSARGRRGRAFCPTPRAVALLERAGAEVEPHPSLEVLRLVNSRAFAARVGPLLPGAAFVTERAVAEAKLAKPPEGGSEWRVKRQHGMAGRNQRLVSPARRSAGDDAFLDAGFAEGGVQIEPNVAIVAEYGKHGMIAHAGGLLLGVLVRQQCDERGVWIASEAATGPSGEEQAIDEALTAQARLVADALFTAGYFGPFGIDAFTFRQGGGHVTLHPMSEINARYSMAFGLGFPRS